MNNLSRMTYAILVALLFTLTGCNGDKEELVTVKEDEKFKPGQVWKYKTREGEEASRVTILRVESTKGTGTVVHIAVDNLKLIDEEKQETRIYDLKSIPIARAALNQSVVEVESTDGEVPDYSNWKEPYPIDKKPQDLTREEKQRKLYYNWRANFEHGTKLIYNQRLTETIEAREGQFAEEEVKRKEQQKQMEDRMNKMSNDPASE